MGMIKIKYRAKMKIDYEKHENLEFIKQKYYSNSFIGGFHIWLNIFIFNINHCEYPHKNVHNESNCG